MANKVRVSHILVENLEVEVVTNVFDVDFHTIIRPLGVFTLTFGGLGSDSLHTGVDNDVGVHLAESVGVTLKTSFDNENL